MRLARRRPDGVPERARAGQPFYQIYLMDLTTGDVERVSPGRGKTTCAFICPGKARLTLKDLQQVLSTTVLEAVDSGTLARQLDEPHRSWMARRQAIGKGYQLWTIRR